MPCHHRDALIRQTYLIDPNLLTLAPQLLNDFKLNCSNYFNNLPTKIQSAINNRINPPAPQQPTPQPVPAAQPSPAPQPTPAAQPTPQPQPTNPDEDIDFKLDLGPTYRDPSNNPSGPKRKF